ncbi:hypothetical protein ED733_003242 [Metarhizium rileyi]|uniref:Uncharacterized protein n=1 Tax=Metarhizium rileyi (strain RCEF 4871) TaxID=1649241 RepID=A0A5C6G599_METRR|nr:hypothetical protein ED733_003242 [Metarhizium rileyi]
MAISSEDRPSSTSVEVDRFLRQIATIFKSSHLIDFPGFELHVTTERRCILIWNTRQNDRCPGHILEWDDTNPRYIKVTSSQYAKTIKCDIRFPKTLHIQMPTTMDCGMRKLVYDTMIDLLMDSVLRKKAGIKSVTMTQNTPKKAVWLLTRVKEDDA